MKKTGMVTKQEDWKLRRLEGEKMGLEEYPADYYRGFLEYVKGKYEGQYWHVLPREMARFWKNNDPQITQITQINRLRELDER